MIHHDQRCSGHYGLSHCVKIGAAVCGAGHDDHLYAGALETAQRTHHGIVLDPRSHHAIPWYQQAVQGEIQCIGDVGAQNHPQRILDVKEFRQSLARLVHHTPGGHRKTMARAAGVPPASSMYAIIASATTGGFGQDVAA